MFLASEKTHGIAHYCYCFDRLCLVEVVLSFCSMDSLIFTSLGEQQFLMMPALEEKAEICNTANQRRSSVLDRSPMSTVGKRHRHKDTQGNKQWGFGGGLSF